MARHYRRSYAQSPASEKQQKKSGAISPYSRPFPKPQPLQAKAVEPPTEAMQAQAAKYNALKLPVQAPETTPAATGMPLMPKLAIGAVNDPYEQEADRVASQVVQQLNSPPDMMQRLALEASKPSAVEMQPLLQPKRMAAGGVAPPGLEESIQRERAKGQSLADSIRQPMERAMSADFSGVRIHTDSTANELSESIQAKAFTTGQDVFFRQGAYAPQSQAGQSLLAHELTHVVQQTGSTVQRHPDRSVIQRMTAAELEEAKEEQLKADVKQYIALFNRSTTLQKKDFESLKQNDISSVIAVAKEIKTKITDQPLFDAIGRYAKSEFSIENPNALLMLNATRDDHAEQLMAVAERLTPNISYNKFSGSLPKGVSYYSGEVPQDVNLSSYIQQQISDAYRRLLSAMYEVDDRGGIVRKRLPTEVDVPTAVTAQLDLVKALAGVPKEVTSVLKDTLSRMGYDPAVQQALSQIKSLRTTKTKLRTILGGGTKGKIMGGMDEILRGPFAK